MPKTATIGSSKERLLKATACLLAERGYDGVGLALIAKTAETTTGSLYFHFPEGKEALAVAAIDAAAEGRRKRIAEALAAGGPAEIARLWADHLESSDWKIGCPVAATTLQMASRSEALRKAGQRAFERWQSEIEGYLSKTSSVDPSQSARYILSLLEGAELIAKTSRDRTPLSDAAKAIDSYLKWAEQAQSFAQ